MKISRKKTTLPRRQRAWPRAVRAHPAGCRDPSSRGRRRRGVRTRGPSRRRRGHEGRRGRLLRHHRVRVLSRPEAQEGEGAAAAAGARGGDETVAAAGPRQPGRRLRAGVLPAKPRQIVPEDHAVQRVSEQSECTGVVFRVIFTRRRVRL